ncbi:MAG TPA: PilW family protein, partial [Usitatibacter sp.]|nr:PilW family protein [Usitatibacter sp.]
MNRMSRSRRSMQGLSLVELMIAMTLGLIVLAALVSVFANTSASRAELERVSRQIENGRFAMELLSDDLRHAGFYGEANVKAVIVPGAMPDPCSIDKDVWKASMPIHVQAYDNGNLLPPCFAGTRKPDTDVLVIRRASTCEAGVADCPVRQPLEPYVQISKCADQTPITPFTIGTFGTDPFTLLAKNCTDPAELRKYIMRFYYISTDNGAGVAIPTLKRIDLVGASFVETALVEGIEELNLEYGIDTDGDGGPDA